MTILTFIPLEEAAAKLGLSEDELRSRVESGTITAGKLPDGEIVVSTDTMKPPPQDDINARLRAVKREDYEHLKGQPITVSEAAKKYGVKRRTILEWVKQKYITVLAPGYRMKIDEADVAYCAAIHVERKQTGVRFGAPLLDQSGKPYLLKHPNLSKYRREQRQSEAAST